MGHSVTVPLDDHYHKPVLETLYNEYEKHIPELMNKNKDRATEKAIQEYFVIHTTKFECKI